MKEKHLLLDKNSIIEIEGQFYIPESKVPTFVSKQGVLPIYFVSTREAKVYPDSPVIGCEEFGPWYQDPLKGPFFDLEEAKRIVKEREEKVDKISYEFSGKIISRVVPLEGAIPSNPSEISIYKYFQEGCELSAGQESGSLFPKYNISNEQVEALYEILKQRAKDKAKETKDFEDKNVKGLSAIIERGGTTLIELTLNEISPFKRFVLKSFSDSRQYHNFDSDLEKLNINSDAFKKDPTLEAIGLSPVEFSIDDSLDDIVKRNNLIY